MPVSVTNGCDERAV